MTFSDIAYDAMRLTGQLMPGLNPAAAGGNMAPEMLSDCLRRCNSMLDAWNAERLMCFVIDDQYFDINTSQQSYTLGPSGDFALPYRPESIDAANLVLLTNVTQPTRIPCEIIYVQDWSEIPVIAIQSQITIKIYVQMTYPNVTVWCFPFPTTGNQFEFFMRTALTQFASVDSTFALPPGYQEAITYGLADRMLPLNTKQLNISRQDRAQLRMDARAAKRVIEGANAPTPTLSPDLITQTSDGTGAPFSYLYGDYSV